MNKGKVLNAHDCQRIRNKIGGEPDGVDARRDVPGLLHAVEINAIMEVGRVIEEYPVPSSEVASTPQRVTGDIGRGAGARACCPDIGDSGDDRPHAGMASDEKVRPYAIEGRSTGRERAGRGEGNGG